MRPEPACIEPLQAALAAAIRGPWSDTLPLTELEQFLREHGATTEDAHAAATPLTRARLSLYRELVHHRFRAALESSIPRTLARLGPERVQHELSRFLERCGSRSPYLRDVAAEFVTFSSAAWRSDPSVPRWLGELARHELLPVEVGAAEDEPATPVGEVSLASRLRVQRGARLVRHEYAVHHLPPHPEMSEPERRACWILAYRDPAGRVRYLELTDLAAAIVSRLRHGEPLGDATREGCHATGLDLDDGVLGEVALLLEDLERRGVIIGADDG